MSNFNHGVKSFGVPVLPGIGGNVYTGNVYFVSSTSTTRSDSPSAGTKDAPFASIDYAVGRCTASNGDVIIAMPGHIETVAVNDGLAIDVAGITFIVTPAAADRLKISGWIHNGATAAGADTALSIVGGDGIVVEDFSIFGNFAVAAIENVTTAMTNARIGGGGGVNYIQNGLDSTTPVAITLVSTSTGPVGPNINIRIGLDTTSNTINITEAVVGAAMQMFLPINICNLGGEVAMATNIVATTDA